MVIPLERTGAVREKPSVNASTLRITWVDTPWTARTDCALNAESASLISLLQSLYQPVGTYNCPSQVTAGRQLIKEPPLSGKDRLSASGARKVKYTIVWEPLLTRQREPPSRHVVAAVAGLEVRDLGACPHLQNFLSVKKLDWGCCFH